MDTDLSGITSQTDNADPVFRSVEKYANHPRFSFKYVTRNKIAKEIQNLDSKTACRESDIPVKLMKKTQMLFLLLSTITSITLYSVSASLQNQKMQM